MCSGSRWKGKTEGGEDGVCYRKGEGGGKVEQATLTLGIIKAIFCVCDTKQKRKC